MQPHILQRQIAINSFKIQEIEQDIEMLKAQYTFHKMFKSAQNCNSISSYITVERKALKKLVEVQKFMKKLLKDIYEELAFQAWVNGSMHRAEESLRESIFIDEEF